MKEGFKLTPEQIVFLYMHLTDYKNTIEQQVVKQLEISQGQLQLLEKVYGRDHAFNKDNHELYNQLYNEEMPKIINSRLDFLNSVIDLFKDSYEIINDVDPEFVDSIQDKYFTPPQAVTDLIQKIKDNNEH